MKIAMFVLFCACSVADAQTLAARVDVCSQHLKTEGAQNDFDVARIWAEKIFTRKFQRNIEWGNCSGPDFRFDFQMTVAEISSDWHKPLDGYLISNGNGTGLVVVNYPLAKEWSHNGEFSVSKIMGAGILAAIVGHFARIHDFKWALKYDLGSIEADNPQGYGNEIVEAVQDALRERDLPPPIVPLSLQEMLPVSYRAPLPFSLVTR